MSQLSLGRVAAMVPVSDIQRARKFYETAFGLSVVFENGDPVVRNRGAATTAQESSGVRAASAFGCWRASLSLLRRWRERTHTPHRLAAVRTS